jgi:hypothetical protein
MPVQSDPSMTDKVLEKYSNTGIYRIGIDEAISILSTIKSDPGNDWSVNAYINAFQGIKSHKELSDTVMLIVRRNRDISSGTGTLLSKDDRESGKRHSANAVITLYRLNGGKDKGWNGHPFWIPNIKLPFGKVFHRVDNE